MLKAIQQKVDTLRRNLPYVTPHKAANLVLNQLEIRARRRRFYSMPHTLHIEPSTVCNTDCQLCPVGLKYHKDARHEFQRFMSLEHYQRIVDMFKRHVIALNIGLWGEPTLNREIQAMVEYAHRQRLLTTILTNGHYTAKKLALVKDLFITGLDHALISIHGMSQQTFAAYQPSKQFDDVWAVIEELAAFTRSLKRSKAIALAFAISNKNEHELGAFKRACERLGVDPCCYPASLNIRYLADQEQKQQRIKGWRSDNHKDELLYPYYDRVLQGPVELPEEYPPGCWHMTSAMSVQVDGDVVACCGAFPPHGETFSTAGLTAGNLLEPGVTVDSIWNGPFFQAGRDLVLRGKRRPGQQLPCYHCLDYIA